MFTVVALTATVVASISFGVVFAKKSARRKDWLDKLESKRALRMVSGEPGE